MNQAPTIKKATCVQGKTLKFKNATVNDAEFILSLRTDIEKSKYLSVVSNDVLAQQNWLKKYEQLTDQAYFIIHFNDEPIGTVRLYDQQGESFSWGSWVLKNTRPSHAAMESALMVYSYGINYLKFKAAHFDVRKGNERVWQFHESFGAVRTGENDLDYLYSINEQSISESRIKYQRFLDKNVEVVT